MPECAEQSTTNSYWHITFISASGISGKRKTRLIDVSDRPIWSGTEYSHVAEDTLIPDLITISGAGDETTFVIFDAKYYTPQIQPGSPLRGQPGIESISKQYLYQLAYRDFVEKHQIKKVVNCFLLPTAEPEVADAGTVSLGMLDQLGLEKIQVRFLPATMMFDYYLAGEQIDVDTLQL